MLSVTDIMDIRMQQHIAQEIYRQQIMQRLPDPFSSLMSFPISSHHVIASTPAHLTLPDVTAKLENTELWQQFHQIGTEMIITKTGRRMFPSKRLSLSGLEEDTNYCVLLEMVPIGDCRYKFSGSQWVPAGGAEPQSPQRMYLHPDSPATGAHWQSQPILFNKVKLTNNTMDQSGHIVLTSMHKYQPRIHVIRTSDLSEIPWAPQQAFVFPETNFVAVTAYQNDRITKLKIDNNPFAKGFRETGQSRCKRKLLGSNETGGTDRVDTRTSRRSSCSSSMIDDDHYSVSSCDVPEAKRFHSNECLDDVASGLGGSSPCVDDVIDQRRRWLPSPQSQSPDSLLIPCFAASPATYPACWIPPHSGSLTDHQPPESDQPESVYRQTTVGTVSAKTTESICNSQPTTQSTRAKLSNFSIAAILAY